MNSKIVLSVLLGCSLFVSAGAAEDPAKSRLLKQCESAKGEVKAECQEVAKDMLRKDAPTEERPDQSSQDVTHSSPVMTSPQEAKREAKQKKPKPAPEPKSVPKRSE
ncbi:MAG TPA: hypothetical protein VNR40_17225 [Steroidobacter sp.]|nr:hypothetical protein [Steroidobacter sp.]